MRGDRPVSSDFGSFCFGATPHARGSTLDIPEVRQLRGGYPACAGIDPFVVPSYTIVGRLPRMRGDRPHIVAVLSTGVPATPHARGSTSATPSAQSGTAGYPACAGIDLVPDMVVGVVEWLPRMRGDRPSRNREYVAAHSATPHARGSTRTWPGRRTLPKGYPACAGIDLGMTRLPARLHGLPRMRGDRPS